MELFNTATKINAEDSIAINRDNYDTVIYSGGIFSNTHPDHLYCLGKLYGLNPAAAEKCRVLEIGCAIGSNLLPLAMAFPDSDFVGIDLAPKQIQEAESLKKESGLKNIRFINASITELKEDIGKFDYVICHGVFSWVPKVVQDAILATCRDNLNEDGMAIISYNTKPGWCHIAPIRDAMYMHGNRFNEPKDKLAQAKAYMKFILEAMPNRTEGVGKMLQDKYDMFMKSKDYYLYHELLEPDNTPLYFTEFMEMAKEHNLQYLSETAPQYMMNNNLSQKFLDIAKQATDRVIIEQMHDFITNRQFRSTILVKEGKKLNMQWTPEAIEKFAFSFSPRFRKNQDGEWKLGDNVVNISSNNADVNTVLDHLNKIRTPKTLKTISDETKVDEKVVRDFFLQNAIGLFAKSLLQFHSVELHLPKFDASKLKTHPLIIASAKRDYALHVTNMIKMQVQIDSIDKLIIPMLDGKCTVEKVGEMLVKSLGENKITLQSKENVEQTDEDKAKFLKEEAKRRIGRYAANGLLM